MYTSFRWCASNIKNKIKNEIKMLFWKYEMTLKNKKIENRTKKVKATTIKTVENR